jgi:hypothetical protein
MKIGKTSDGFPCVDEEQKPIISEGDVRKEWSARIQSELEAKQRLIAKGVEFLPVPIN